MDTKMETKIDLRLTKAGFQLKFTSDGRLLHWVVGDDDIVGKSVQKSVVVRRCFPWSKPLNWLSLRDEEGHELELIEDPETALDETSRGELYKALEESSFVFVVERILSVTEEFELRQWRVQLREGERIFQTKLSVWPRELANGGLLIQDVANDLYLIASPESLDAASQKLLWAFVDD